MATAAAVPFMPVHHLMNPNPFASPAATTTTTASGGFHHLPSWLPTSTGGVSNPPFHADPLGGSGFGGANIAFTTPSSSSSSPSSPTTAYYNPHHHQQQSQFQHSFYPPQQQQQRRGSKRSRAAAELDDVLSIKRQCTQTPPSHSPPPQGYEQASPFSPPQHRATSVSPFSVSPSTPPADDVSGFGGAIAPLIQPDSAAFHHQRRQQRDSRSLVGPLATSPSASPTSLVHIEDHLPSPPSALPFVSPMRPFLSSPSCPSSTAIAVRSPNSRFLLPVLSPPSSVSSSAIVPYQRTREMPLWRPMRTPFVTHVEEVESSDDDDRCAIEASTASTTTTDPVDSMDCMDDYL